MGDYTGPRVIVLQTSSSSIFLIYFTMTKRYMTILDSSPPFFSQSFSVYFLDCKWLVFRRGERIDAPPSRLRTVVVSTVFIHVRVERILAPMCLVYNIGVCVCLYIFDKYTSRFSMLMCVFPPVLTLWRLVRPAAGRN